MAEKGTVEFAKSLAKAAFQKGVLKEDLTVQELLKTIPDDADVGTQGGVLAWSGYLLVYPK